MTFAVVGALALGAATASAAPTGWSEPQDLSDVFEVGALEGLGLNYPDIAVSGSGDATIAWVRQEQLADLSYLHEVFTRDRPLGGAWGTTTLLWRGQYSSDPRVATNAGTTVIAWESSRQVLVRVRRAGGGFTTKNLGAGYEVQVGVDDAGRAIVLWSGGGVDYGIRAARYVPGSGWSATTTISFSPTAQTPDLAVSGNGDAIATWKAEDGVRVTEFTPSGGWTAHRLIGAGGVRPSVATNDAGEVVLAWTLFSAAAGGTSSVQSVRGSIRGGLSSAQQLSDDVLADWYMDEPTAETAMGPSGDGAVAWNRPASWAHDQNVQIATGRATSGYWGYPRSVAVPTWSPRPSLGIFADGTVLAVWRGGNAAIRPAGGLGATATGWTLPFSIATAGSEPYNPDVALDDAGRVHVAWADLSRPQVRMEDHLAAMAVQVTSFGAPGTPPAPTAPTAPVIAPPAPTPSAAPTAPTAPSGVAGGVSKSKTATPKPTPALSVVWRKGKPYVSLRLNVPRALSGRVLVLEQKVGRRAVALSRFRAAKAGPLARLVPLSPKAVTKNTVLSLRLSVSATAAATGASSAYRAVSLRQHRR